MRFSTAAFLASLALVSGAPAFAQGLGNDVQVNPLSPGSTVLLYPGGQYMRVVRPLLMPGQGNGPVRLHLPRKGAARASGDRSAAMNAQPRPRAPRKLAAAAPPPDTSGAYYGGFGAPMGASSLLGGYTPPPPAAPRAAAAPKPAPKPVQLAKAEPAPAATAEAGLSKRSVILFAPQASDPAESALGAIKFLAGDLNASMLSPNSRIQIQAFGGQHGDKGSDARRLSLKRALAIRQVLIDDGVPAERIDVRAMGGSDDSGPTDRVDIYVKA